MKYFSCPLSIATPNSHCTYTHSLTHTQSNVAFWEPKSFCTDIQRLLHVSSVTADVSSTSIISLSFSESCKVPKISAAKLNKPYAWALKQWALLLPTITTNDVIWPSEFDWIVWNTRDSLYVPLFLHPEMGFGVPSWFLVGFFTECQRSQGTTQGTTLSKAKCPSVFIEVLNISKIKGNR